MARPRGIVVGFWISTALFCAQMAFTAYAQLRLPQVAQAFAHLGFPDWFRVELSWAKLAGVVLLLAPVPPLLKEWAYAGFAIDLASAIVAHVAVGDGAAAWSWPVAFASCAPARRCCSFPATRATPWSPWVTAWRCCTNLSPATCCSRACAPCSTLCQWTPPASVARCAAPSGPSREPNALRIW